jgi:hypothetical protein
MVIEAPEVCTAIGLDITCRFFHALEFLVLGIGNHLDETVLLVEI